MNDDFRYAMLTILAIMLSIFASGLACAHDHRRPDLNSWYGSLHSGKGLCCDGSDAKRVDDADWDSKDGHYRVRIDGEWVDVPQEAVVEGPNRAGGLALLSRWSSESALLHAREHELMLFEATTTEIFVGRQTEANPCQFGRPTGVIGCDIIFEPHFTGGHDALFPVFGSSSSSAPDSSDRQNAAKRRFPGSLQHPNRLTGPG
jgi:hypothetical protein